MKTNSLGIANYCVPCRANCRYCLLDSCRQATGVAYERGAQFADRVSREIGETREDVYVYYYIGYCMDTPKLKEYIRFCQERDYSFSRFLQMNGFGFRNEEELERLMREIRDSGVELIDLTFYGLRDYHDRFAGRKGDFDFLLSMLAAANKADLPVKISAPLFRENAGDSEALLTLLSNEYGVPVSFFLPHAKGRGKGIEELRLTKNEFDALSENVKARFAKTPHHTEAEWLKLNEWPDYQERDLTLVLHPGEMDRLEKMHGLEVLRFMEALDDRYSQFMPGPDELARMYGDPENQRLFRVRDLLLLWQQRYLREHGGAVHDMRDETHHFSVYR